ncbi:Putative phosphatidate phosphatase [Frankliniella fusca]|uniref:Phosphatidate phosphatase n=1 Tax=Frankliniella fusca TaxID=407009 RepID=A0AAE1HQB7_9NEOP|nr:Putative phosphatidate phosphatase [Frankliniella fusca]
MNTDSKYILRKFLIDVAVLLARPFTFSVGMPVLLLYLFGQPYERGFFCNDESIMLPFRESTISNAMLLVVGLILPILLIIVNEFYSDQSTAGHVDQFFVGRAIPPWVCNSYKVIGVFGFGAASSQLTTDIAKYTIGRLRPHFISVCQPSIDCTLIENQHKYFESFECTANIGSPKLKEARLSFPSGHSSLSAYAMLFLVFYIQSRITFKGSKLLRHAIQYSCLMFSWFCALSRISNYWHHWSDVLSGLFIGGIVAILTVVFVADLLPRGVTEGESRLHKGNAGRENQISKYDAIS